MKNMSPKLLAARAQLGTALDLFLADQDPISVHALACGAREVLRAMAKRHGVDSFYTNMFEGRADITAKQLAALRNGVWNAMKHPGDTRGGRNDDHLLRGFSDTENDPVLFEGWHDYMLVTGQLPVEAQAFITCRLAQMKNLDADTRQLCDQVFPEVHTGDRRSKKGLLRAAVDDIRQNGWVDGDPRTEAMPLRLSLETLESLRLAP